MFLDVDIFLGLSCDGNGGLHGTSVVLLGNVVLMGSVVEALTWLTGMAGRITAVSVKRRGACSNHITWVTY